MAEILTPTYYGPAPQNKAGGTGKDAQTAGSLNCAVAQPAQVEFIDRRWNGKYTEVWKGPYSVLKDYPQTTFVVGYSRDVAIGKMGSFGIARFSAPDPGTDQYGIQNAWMIDNVKVTQLPAGDHALLTVTYSASSVINWGGSAGAKEDPSQESWQLEWQPYTIRPYAWCKNEVVKDPLASADDDKDSTAWRKNIEDFFRSSKGDKSKGQYQNAPGTQLYKLNIAEQNVAQKVLSDTVCIWHSPVVTHIKVATMPIGTDITFIGTPQPPWNDFGNGLDQIVKLDGSCPFSSLNDEWTFVHTADTCTQERTNNNIVFTRRSVSIGMKTPDINYYGTTPFSHNNLKNCRWEIGKI